MRAVRMATPYTHEPCRKPAGVVCVPLVRFALRIARSQVEHGALACRRKRAMQQPPDLQRPHDIGKARVVLEDGTPRVAATRDLLERAFVRD